MASCSSLRNKTTGISKKSLYKPAPKENLKNKRTNRKTLAQGQLVDFSNPRSIKSYKNGLKSLQIGTLERNFLSPDVQRRETINTPGRTLPSCGTLDEIDNENRRNTLMPLQKGKINYRPPSVNGLFSPLGKTIVEDDFQSPHRTINLDLSDGESDDKMDATLNNDTEKENRNKVDVFMADILDDPYPNTCSNSFASLDLSVCKEDSIAKVICHTPRSAKKKLLGQSPFVNCKKSSHVAVAEIKPVSLFSKESNSVLLNDTQIPNYSSGSDEELSISKRPVALEKNISKVKKKGRIVPSRYMQSAQNFVASKTPKKDSNKSHNFTLSKGNSKNLSTFYNGSKNSTDEADSKLPTCPSKSEDATNNAQTSTPNKDDLPMPYSDASTIMQDISTISEIDRTVRRDLFTCNIKNQDTILSFPTMEQEKKVKSTVDQMDLEILYSQYLRSLYLDKMFQNSFKKREEEVMIQLQGLSSEIEKMMKKKSDLDLKIAEEEYNKVATKNAEKQRKALELVNFSLPDFIPNHEHLAAALDTTRHQIATHGIHLPKDEEVFTDELATSLQETQQLLEKIKESAGEEDLKSLTIYSSVLKKLTETAWKEDNEIEKLNEILAATESLTVHQASLNIQEIQDLCTVASFQLNI